MESELQAKIAELKATLDKQKTVIVLMKKVITALSAPTIEQRTASMAAVAEELETCVTSDLVDTLNDALAGAIVIVPHEETDEHPLALVGKNCDYAMKTLQAANGGHARVTVGEDQQPSIITFENLLDDEGNVLQVDLRTPLEEHYPRLRHYAEKFSALAIEKQSENQ